MTSQHHIINWIRPIFSFLQTYLSRVIGLKSYKVSIFSRRNWKSLTTVCLSWSASFPSDKSLMNSAVIFFQSQYFYVLPKSKQCTFISRDSGRLQLISVSESFSSPQHFLLFSPPDITLDRTTRFFAIVFHSLFVSCFVFFWCNFPPNVRFSNSASYRVFFSLAHPWIC